jgi:hypothetical protein
MAELTIQISDELAQRLEPLQNRLPELLWRLLEVVNLQTTSGPTVKTEITDIPAVYQEVIDFLIKQSRTISVGVKTCFVCTMRLSRWKSGWSS